MTAAVRPAEADTANAAGTGVLSWVLQIVAWLVILIVSGLLIVMLAVPRIAGATPYTVLTGSMTPTYPAGSLVVVKPVDTAKIGIGTPITYQLESGKGSVVTHRVVAVGQTADGETSFRTQGDANDAIDAEPVRPVQIRGEVWYGVPYLGYVNTALTGSQRQVVVYGISGALLLYAGFMLGGALRDRVRKRPEASLQAPETESVA